MNDQNTDSAMIFLRHEKKNGSCVASLTHLPKVIAAAVMLHLAGPIEAATINKCVIDGKVTYQDTPCPGAGETREESLAKEQRNEALHRKLDQLAAQGNGMVRRPPPKPQVRPPQPESYRPSTSDAEVQAALDPSRYEEQTARNNAESAAALSKAFDELEKQCGGKLAQYPEIGMTDKKYRECTLHARFGVFTQVVVSEDNGTPLRLYILANDRANRVYSIGGVITAIKD